MSNKKIKNMLLGDTIVVMDSNNSYNVQVGNGTKDEIYDKFLINGVSLGELLGIFTGTELVYDTTTNDTVQFSGLLNEGENTLTVDWGDGSGYQEIEKSSNDTYSYTYPTTFSMTTFSTTSDVNTKTVKIKNNLKQIGYNSTHKFSTNLTKISQIGKEVKTIGNYAFQNCTKLTSISIPNSISSIGVHVFDKCSKLSSIPIPSNTTEIGNYAFSGCKSLESFDIPSSVSSINQCAFANCIKLTSINIPDGVTNIGLSAFENCSSLTSLNIPDNVEYIDTDAFIGCSGQLNVAHTDISSSMNKIEILVDGTTKEEVLSNFMINGLTLEDLRATE